MSTETTKDYNPHEHLVKIRSKDGAMKDYYPANWRLYEARLRFPDIVLESEIVHMDVEHNFVIVRALVFVGIDYVSATLKCSAMKQGLLSALDKVETAAKARALRDLGISTELALEFEAEDEEPAPTLPRKNQNMPLKPPQASQQPKTAETVHHSPATAKLPSEPPQMQGEDIVKIRTRLNELFPRANKLGLCSNGTEFLVHISKLIERKVVKAADLTQDDLAMTDLDLAHREQEAQPQEAA